MRISLKKSAVWALLIALTTWNVAVAKDEKKKENIYQNTEVLARGPNGLVVTVSDILSEVNKMNPAMRSDFFKNQANVRQIANNLLVRRILAAEAQKEKLDRDLVVQAAMVVAKDRVLSDARLNQMDVANEPTEKAIEAYAQSKYRANIEKYEVPAQTRASHILIEKKDENSLKEAQSLVTKIKEGAKFEDMAKEFSKDPGSASRGGDLGFFTAGRMVKTFEDATNALAKPGDISDPVESQFGYHIIRLDERQAKTVKSFDEVRLQLMSEARADLLSQKRVQKVQAITNTMNFEDKAIENFSKEGLDAMTQK